MKLKNISRLLLMASVILFLAPSCVKEGPMGPAGADGVDGKDGANGADGQVTCLVCHSGTNMAEKKAQFAMSEHSVGAIAVDYAGGRASCAQCHSHEGFIQWAEFGKVAGDITDPSAWKCSTCHGLHQTFEAKDYAFRVSGPAKLYPDNTKTKTLDVKGNSNLCATCHQARVYEPNIATPGETFKITSTHYGPHHGPQGNIVAGIGFAEIPGSVAYPVAGSSKHLEQASCTGCHMATFTAKQGGHSFIPSVDACNKCHGATLTDYNYGGVQSDVKAKLDQLRDKLVELGVVEYIEADAAYEPKVGTYPMIQAQAYFNWIGITEDRSEGVHNPKYVKALLTNTLEALNK
ncbi:MAG: hypothetical protein WAO52_14930 [Prolixibacteraceae bacterium]